MVNIISIWINSDAICTKKFELFRISSIEQTGTDRNRLIKIDVNRWIGHWIGILTLIWCKILHANRIIIQPISNKMTSTDIICQILNELHSIMMTIAALCFEKKIPNYFANTIWWYYYDANEVGKMFELYSVSLLFSGKLIPKVMWFDCLKMCFMTINNGNFPSSCRMTIHFCL